MARQNGIATPRIAVIAADPWPLPWYLRHFNQVGFWQPGQKVIRCRFLSSLQPRRPTNTPINCEISPGVLRSSSRRAHPVVVAGAQMKSMAEIYQFNHHAMATYFQVRISNQDKTYAAQAAHAALDLLDGLEARLSRFRTNSDIAQITQLAPGEKMRLSEPAFACLQIAKRMEQATHSAFCPTPAALKARQSLPRWELLPEEHSILCVSGPARIRSRRDRQGVRARSNGRTLASMGLPIIFAHRGWQQHSRWRSARRWSWLVLWPGRRRSHRRDSVLTHASLSGSGLAVKGTHILDPRTGVRRRGKAGRGLSPILQPNRMRFQPRAWFSASRNSKRCSLRIIPGFLFSKQMKDTSKLEGAHFQFDCRVSVTKNVWPRVQDKPGETPINDSLLNGPSARRPVVFFRGSHAV